MPEKPLSYIVTKIPQNFVYPEIKHEDFRFGSGQLVGTPLRPDGDWRDYLPPEEDQNIRGIESAACYVEASQHTIATLEEEMFDEKGNNYSARFNALLSGGTSNGGSPLAGGDSIRHDGLVPDSLMPFGGTINSWQDFHSWKDVVESVVRATGKTYLGKKILGYDIVCEKYEPVATKYIKLKQSLQYSPCPVSVTAWYENDGVYYKPEGLSDNHLVELVYIDEFNHPYIRDTYAPYLKKLDTNFNFDFAMRWSVEKKSTMPKKSITEQINDLLAWIASLVPSTPVPPPTLPSSPKANKLYDTAFSLIGKDASPKDVVDDELSCAESLSNIIQTAFPELKFPTFLSTRTLYNYLITSPSFKPVNVPSKGDIIMAVTGTGSGAMAHGHSGVMGRIKAPDGSLWIMSTTSKTGLWEVNYTLNQWKASFEKIGGFPTRFLRVVEPVGTVDNSLEGSNLEVYNEISMNISPAWLGFLRGAAVVIVTAVLTYLANAANLTGLVPEGLAAIIASAALALEHSIEAKTGKAAFGAITTR